MTPRPLLRAASLLLTSVLVASLTGCGAEDVRRAEERRASSERPAAEPSRSPGADASPDADGRELGAPAQTRRPSGQRTRVAPAPVRPRGNALSIDTGGPDRHLVAAADLGPRWRERATTHEDGRVMSACHAASLHDVGAVKVRLRDFDGPGRAVQASARFVDHRSSLRIERVVRAWERDCARSLARRGAALDVLRHGRWLAVVEVSGVARPARAVRRALAAAAATF